LAGRSPAGSSASSNVAEYGDSDGEDLVPGASSNVAEYGASYGEESGPADHPRPTLESPGLAALEDEIFWRNFKKNLMGFITSKHLESFFPHGDPFLDKVIAGVKRLQNDGTGLTEPSRFAYLAYLALYRVVVYCGRFQPNSYCT
jgi:hypothetical protein